MAISYLNDILHIEDTPLTNIVKKYPSPFYIYSAKQIEDNLNLFKNAISCINGKVFYSVKANSNLSVLKLFKDLGCGFDIVSLGELLRLKQINCPACKIVFSGVGKTQEELKEAIFYGIKSINVESYEELEEIINICQENNKKANVMVRINPNVSANTHHKISTGKQEDKFGVSLNKITAFCTKAQNSKYINLLGVACHIGSQIFETKNFALAYKKVLQTVTELEKQGLKIKTLDLGGGFGVPYHNEKEFNLKNFSNILKEIFANTNYEICFEPGRFLIANAGLLISKVIRVKQQSNKVFVVLNSSMADLIRPSLYNAYHAIKPLVNNSTNNINADIVGPICESGDTFHKNYKIKELQKNDFVAIFNTGAYCASMSNNYNSKLLTSELMVLCGKTKLIKKQSYNHLLAIENIIN